jgi:VanZ family protein
MEYSVLGWLTARAVLNGRSAKHLGLLLLVSGLMVMAGGLDEWHQSFVPGRMAQGIDVFFDTICGIFGALVFQVWFFRRVKNNQ